MSVTYCYRAKAKSTKKEISLTPEEIEVNTRPVEMSFDEAFDRINKEYNKNSNDNSLRSILIMKEIK